MFDFLGKIGGRILVLAFVLGALWLLLSGYLDKATLVGFGAMSVVLTVWLTHHMGLLDEEGVPTGVFPGIIGYMLWLTLEIGKANFLVAREVFRPTMRLSPKLLRVPAVQRNDLGKTIFANSLTLTPGTVTIDVGTSSLLVHALTEELADEGGMASMGEKVDRLDRASRKKEAGA
jgi:multicomponent Na+:H+ antiporter subunit E